MSKPFLYICGRMNVKAPPDQIEITKMKGGRTIRNAKIKMASLKKPVCFNFRFDHLPASSDPYVRDKLSEIELSYYKQNGNNATLFIHGYNVPYGKYGEELIAVDVPDLSYYPKPLPTVAQAPYADGVDFNLGEHYSLSDYMLVYGSNWRVKAIGEAYDKVRIYRSAKQIKQRFKGVDELADLSDDRLNGSGAHNWWVHMEYNLNKAAGFKGFDYYYTAGDPHYTRLVQMAWQGNPMNALDYLQIEPNAIKTAPKVAAVIKQLHDEGITVNVIAHSAGNIVLTHAMNYLCAKTWHYDYDGDGSYQEQGRANPNYKKYNNAIDNAFLWEAAMPNTALSPEADKLDPTIFKRYHTQWAYLAAKTIHVFYSEYDNVLGPIPTDMAGNSKEDMQAKYNSSGGGALMTSSALGVGFISQLEKNGDVSNPLGSAYIAAQMFGVPLDALLMSGTVRTQVYQAWYAQNEAVAKHQAWRADLKDQQSRIQKQYPVAFRNLSYFVGLYLAIMDGSVVAFCQDKNNHHYIADLRKTLTPEQAGKFLTMVESFAKNDQVTSLKVVKHVEEAIKVVRAAGLISSGIAKTLLAIHGVVLKPSTAESPQEKIISITNYLLDLIDNPKPVVPNYWMYDAKHWSHMDWDQDMQYSDKVAYPMSGPTPAVSPRTAAVMGDMVATGAEDVWDFAKNVVHDDAESIDYAAQSAEHKGKQWAEEAAGSEVRSATKKSIDRPSDFKENQTTDNQALKMGAQVATILITISMTPGIKQAPAMGYKGPGKNTRDKLGSKLRRVDQKKWLKNHSAMKIPDEDLKKHMYGRAIMKYPGMKFGKWPL